MEAWPADATALAVLQEWLADLEPAQPRWSPEDVGGLRVAGVFVAGPRDLTGPGDAGDPGWAAAALLRSGSLLGEAVVSGRLGASYQAGLLALREGRLLEQAVRALHTRPDVVLVDATGRDHPRSAGLATHLGWALDLPSIGVTDRALIDPARSVPVQAAPGVRPVLVHPAWRTDAATAVAVIRSQLRVRTPAPLREARRLARQARAESAPPPSPSVDRWPAQDRDF